MYMYMLFCFFKLFSIVCIGLINTRRYTLVHVHGFCCFNCLLVIVELSTLLYLL